MSPPRLFPVLPGNGRITQDDLVVGGYFIPKGVRPPVGKYLRPIPLDACMLMKRKHDHERYKKTSEGPDVT